MNGNILSIMVNDGTEIRQLNKERSATLTISKGFIDGSASSHTTKNYATKKSWDLQWTMLVDETDFILLYNKMANKETLAVKFGGEWTEGAKRIYCMVSGEVYVSKMSFAGQGNGLVQVNLTTQGNGKPVLSWRPAQSES